MAGRRRKRILAPPKAAPAAILAAAVIFEKHSRIFVLGEPLLATSYAFLFRPSAGRKIHGTPHTLFDPFTENTVFLYIVWSAGALTRQRVYMQQQQRTDRAKPATEAPPFMTSPNRLHFDSFTNIILMLFEVQYNCKILVWVSVECDHTGFLGGRNKKRGLVPDC